MSLGTLWGFPLPRRRSDVCHFSIWAESIKFFMIIPAALVWWWMGCMGGRTLSMRSVPCRRRPQTIDSNFLLHKCGRSAASLAGAPHFMNGCCCGCGLCSKFIDPTSHPGSQRVGVLEQFEFSTARIVIVCSTDKGYFWLFGLPLSSTRSTIRWRGGTARGVDNLQAEEKEKPSATNSRVVVSGEANWQAVWELDTNPSVHTMTSRKLFHEPWTTSEFYTSMMVILGSPWNSHWLIGVCKRILKVDKSPASISNLSRNKEKISP